MYFKVRLKEEREKLGLTQQAFGEALGTTKKSQYGYEKGTGYPKADYLIAASDLGVDVLYVLTGKRTANNPEDFERLLNTYNSLSSTGKLTVEKIVSAIKDLDQR